MNDEKKKLDFKKKSRRSSQLIEQNVLELEKISRTAENEMRGRDDLVTDQNNQSQNHNFIRPKALQVFPYEKKVHLRSRFTCKPYSYPYGFVRPPLQWNTHLDISDNDATPTNQHNEQENKHKYEQEHKKTEMVTLKIFKPLAKITPINRWKAKVIGTKKNIRTSSKTGGRPPLFPSSLPPFDNPKDGLLKTLLQMENPEWEVVMLGLQGLVRLCRHHSKLVTASSHSVIQSLVNNIRNLRSQVSRGSCQVAKELFDKVGRFLDAELEDLAGTLLSRTADTNKFLRGDALAALESMVDHTNPVRSVGVLINKGAKHQNALVRCSTARLLLRLAKKLGAERTLSLPRETKDLLVITTAKLLTEGSLETRAKKKKKKKKNFKESKKSADPKEKR